MRDRDKLEYTRWLLARMGASRVETLWLCHCLNDIEFYFLMPDDSNRAQDALEIRQDYISEGGSPIVSSTPTVLEALVGLSERATIMDYDPAWKWFCLFIKNLGFDYLSDDNWSQDAERYVRSTVRKWLDRRFSPSGVGSPFRGNGTYDVTRTSMWYSLQWYLSNEFGEGKL